MGMPGTSDSVNQILRLAATDKELQEQLKFWLRDKVELQGDKLVLSGDHPRGGKLFVYKGEKYALQTLRVLYTLYVGPIADPSLFVQSVEDDNYMPSRLFLGRGPTARRSSGDERLMADLTNTPAVEVPTESDIVKVLSYLKQQGIRFNPA